MNDDREVILSRVRGALAPLPKRAAYPHFSDDVAVMREVVDWKDPWSVFCERAKLVSGESMERVEDVVALLKANHWLHGSVIRSCGRGWRRPSDRSSPLRRSLTGRASTTTSSASRARSARLRRRARSSSPTRRPRAGSARWRRGCTSRCCAARR